MESQHRQEDGSAQLLRLAVAQTAPVLRDFDANAAALAAAVPAGTDLLLTPELSLTGYSVGDAVHRLARPIDVPVEALRRIDAQVIAGMIERCTGGPFNTAVALRNGEAVFSQRKLYLPTYGMFDEARFFGRGNRLDVWQPVPGWTAGVLICEDFWHPALSYVLAMRGIDLLLVQAAGPGRGVWQGGAHGAFASADVWERMARTIAQQYGIFVALSNRVGIEGGVTFAGGSLIVAPDGSVIARAGDRAAEVLRVELDRSVLDAARTPYAHIRDDDPQLVIRELQRGLEARR